MRWPWPRSLINCHEADFQTAAWTPGVSGGQHLTHGPNTCPVYPGIRYQQYVHVTALGHPAA